MEAMLILLDLFPSPPATAVIMISSFQSYNRSSPSSSLQVTGNYTYTDLGIGNHSFMMVADNEYNVDNSPAVFIWTII